MSATAQKPLVLTDKLKHGLVATVVVGSVSAICAFLLLAFVLIHLVRKQLKLKGNARQPQLQAYRPDHPLIPPIAIFYILLIFWDTLVGVGFAMNVWWVQSGQVSTGPGCLTQAVIKQLSDTGAAMSIMGLSWCILHDLVFEFRPPVKLTHAMVIVGVMWIFQILDLLIPNLILGPNKYYGVSGSWCWIRSPYLPAKILTQYIFIWLAAAVSLVTSVLYALRKRPKVGLLWIGFTRGEGELRIGLISSVRNDENRRQQGFSFSYETSTRKISFMFPLVIYLGPRDRQYTTHVLNISDQERLRAEVGAVRREPIPRPHAFKLLLFPITYFMLIFPLSIVRFIRFRKGNAAIPLFDDAMVGSVYALVGLVDAVLFISTGAALGIRD